MLIRAVVLLVIVAAAIAAVDYARRTPHDRYELQLRVLHRRSLDRWRASAITHDVMLRRGQRFSAAVPADGRVFLDLFRRNGSALDHVASASEDATVLETDVGRDGDYVVRVQPALDVKRMGDLSARIEPSLGMPVRGAKRASIQSGFGAPRDAGARRHEGVDIFAPRGTPVVAAADGIVTSVGTNGLGGNVVWETRPLRGESLYYAHLATQLVTPGSYVHRGDVLGTVGNSGNARGGPTHLHFGIYATGGAVDPLPYLVLPAPAAKQRLVDHWRTARR